jgi:molybdopterin-guanine dinucleotide biosynthesis protein A
MEEIRRMSKTFISHSSQDKAKIVEPLVSHLKNNGYQVWYDTEKIKPGVSIPSAVSEGIRSSDTFLLVISENYLQSKWCQKEQWAIIERCIGDPTQRMIVIRVDNAEIEPLIRDVKYLAYNSSIPESLDKLITGVSSSLHTIATEDHRRDSEDFRNKALALIAIIEKAVETKAFGRDLLISFERSQNKQVSLPNEGVILIKPGGTFYRLCLEEILSRIYRKCEIRQMRIFDGERIKYENLFNRQYFNNSQIATGELPLDDDDYRAIRAIYDVPEFTDFYGAPYSDELIIPALQLQDEPYKMTADEITQLWDKGREPGVFYNRNYNGLNKIGFQKTVFPVRAPQYFRQPDVRILLNGFIPGFKRLFEAPDAKVIALHVSTNHPWQEIRDNLVGGKSNPKECEPGSIRRDAADGKIKLDPTNQVVNGQRNVCHSSATLLDGARELTVWFNYHIHDTILGKVLESKGVPITKIQDVMTKNLFTISWTGRNYSFDKMLYDVHRQSILDNLMGAGNKRNQFISDYASKVEVAPDVICNFENFLTFIENGLRLQIAGDDFYLGTIIEHLIDSDELLVVFSEIITMIKDQRRRDDSVQILAEAYRIATSDIRFLACSAFTSQLSSQKLFTTKVIAELAVQSLNCARRTQENLLKEVMTSKSSGTPRESLSISETPQWKDFKTQLQAGIQTQLTELSDTDIVGIILAGGRSTRMSSTIPKAVLPFGESLLLQTVQNNLITATEGHKGHFFAAVGFRSDLIRAALSNQISFLEYGETLGLAFRVATCLEILAYHGYDNKPVVLTYTDMPLVLATHIRYLLHRVNEPRKFGLLISHNHTLSGHIERNEHGVISQIIQQRLNPEKCMPNMERDVGVYIFYNSPEFREALGTIRNNNARKEYIFADIVEILVDRGWQIETQRENFGSCLSVNTAADLLNLASKAYDNSVPMTSLRNAIWHYYGLTIPENIDNTTLRLKVKNHVGPFYFFDWWDRVWSM